jgi:hypothetical protein
LLTGGRGGTNTHILRPNARCWDDSKEAWNFTVSYPIASNYPYW